MKGKKVKLFGLITLLCCCLAFAITACAQGSAERTVSIINKEELTAAWEEDGAERIVEFTVTEDGAELPDASVVVSSDNTSAIAVDGTTLAAVGGGTATITVTYGTASDSVQITVTPKLRGISIVNKAELQDLWEEGDADRTVEVELSPEYFTTENTQVTVTSGAPEVISVSGMTLKALKTGTATITAAAGSFTDTVLLEVRPKLTQISVTNQAELAEEWIVGSERTVALSFEPSNHFTAENTQVTYTFSKEGVVEVAEGNTLRAVGAGTAQVTVSAGTVSDTFTVTTIRTKPSLTLASGGSTLEEDGSGYTISATEGDDVYLPIVTAMTCDGQNISADIERTISEDITLSGDVVGNAAKGTFTVTYSVKDPVDESLESIATVTVNVYRKMFGWQNGSFTATAASDAEQVVTTTNTSFTLAQFNMEASTLYYAEVTYHFSDVEADTRENIVGLAHFMYENDTRFFSASVTRENRDFKFKDSEGNERWSLSNALYSYRLSEYRGIEDGDANEVTFAIARDEDFFYAFVNGQYVGSATDADYQNVPTIPGIFGHAINNAQMKNIVYMSGEDAQTKLNALLAGGVQIGPYCPDTGWASGSLTSFDSAVQDAEGTSESGISFDYTLTTQGANSGMISPYVWVDGNFCIEWVYQNTAVGDGSGEKFMCLQVRRYDYSEPILQFGQRDSDDKFLLDKRPEASGTVEGGKYNQPAFSGFDFSQGARYKLERILHDDHAEYILTVTSVAKPEQTHTRTITLYADEYAGWADPVLFYWKNTYSSGEYSQMKWYVPDTQTAQGGSEGQDGEQ